MTFRFGKYRDCDIRNIPTDYWEWALDNVDLWPRLRAAVIEELRGRGQSDGPTYFTTPAVSVLVEIIKAGRRSLALKYHPDHGGDGLRMQSVNAAADFLETHVQTIGAGR